MDQSQKKYPFYLLFRIEIRMIGKMKMVFDEVKLYGTSFRVESSEKRSEVISELETILFQGINMIEKNSTRKQNSNINS